MGGVTSWNFKSDLLSLGERVTPELLHVEGLTWYLCPHHIRNKPSGDNVIITLSIRLIYGNSGDGLRVTVVPSRRVRNSGEDIVVIIDEM